MKHIKLFFSSTLHIWFLLAFFYGVALIWGIQNYDSLLMVVTLFFAITLYISVPLIGLVLPIWIIKKVLKKHNSYSNSKVAIHYIVSTALFLLLVPLPLKVYAHYENTHMFGKEKQLFLSNLQKEIELENGPTHIDRTVEKSKLKWQEYGSYGDTEELAVYYRSSQCTAEDIKAKDRYPCKGTIHAIYKDGKWVSTEIN